MCERDFVIPADSNALIYYYKHLLGWGTTQLVFLQIAKVNYNQQL